MAEAASLEALVAHLYIVGGRAVGAIPPGALVTAAPKRAPRPRQEETFFALLTPSGPLKAGAAFYEGLAKQAGELYFKTGSSITSGLREVLTQLNTQLAAQPAESRLQANFICAVMRESEVYLARAGAMGAFFYGEDPSLQSFPRDRSPEGLKLAPPLGQLPEPRLELTRFDLKSGAFLLLTDEGFGALSEADLSAALASRDISQTLDPLRKLLRVPLAHAMVIQFVTEDTPTPELSLPTGPADSPPPALLDPLPPEDEGPALPLPLEPLEPQRPSRVMQGLASTLKALAERTDQVGDKIFTPPPPDTPPRPSAWRALASNLLFMVAFLIPLVVVVVVVGLTLSPQGLTDFEVCRVEVLTLQEAARQLTPQEGSRADEAQLQAAREQWEVVKAAALDCERTKPRDEEMLLAAGEAQNNLDRFDRAVRRDVVILRQFPPGADLRGPISGNWISLYTLDRAAGAVYQDILSSDGASLVTASTQPIIFRGQSIGAEVVASVVDLTWLTRGGLPGGINNVALALDNTGLLIWFNENFEGPESYRLITPATWGRPVALTTWGLNLYVLDPTGQQVWRYVPNAGLYSEVPEEYFFGAGEVRPDLSAALDLGVDEDGNLYVLFADGSIRKYRGGEEQAFDFFNLPAGALESGTSLYVDDNPLARGLVVTDPQSQTVYTMSLGGTVNLGYRPRNLQTAFQNLSGAVVNADSNSVYVLAGESLYWLPRQ
jgi:hypothetical protein